MVGKTWSEKHGRVKTWSEKHGRKNTVSNNIVENKLPERRFNDYFRTFELRSGIIIIITTK